MNEKIISPLPAIGERLRSFMAKAGLNDSQFARKTGISHTMVRKVTEGEASISARLLVTIFSVFPTLNPTWLLLGEEEMERGARVGEGVVVKQTAIGNGNRQEVRVHDLEARIASLESLVATKDQVIALLEERIEELKKGG